MAAFRPLSRRRFLAGGIAGAALCSHLSPRLCAAEKTRRTPGIHPFAIAGDKLIVPAGTYDTGARKVVVSSRAELPIRPVDVVIVHDEELQLSEKKPSGFFVGTHLAGTKASNIGALRSLIEESLTLKDASGRTLRKGDDYLVAAPFALLGIGTHPSVTPQTKVYATYSHYTQRIDTIAVDARGVPILISGQPQLVSPAWPAAPAGATAIARVYRPFGGRTLEEAHVFPITERAESAVTATQPGRVPKTLRKLQSGEPATIVCWGDSITVGADLDPADAWANKLRTELARQFPQARITHRNHSIGGTKTAQWLRNGDYPGLPKQNPEKCRFENVLAEKPDLVVMEFLNDIVFPDEVLQRIYPEIHEAFASRGIEWLIVTPSQKMPENFDLGEMKDEQPRRLDTFLRGFARDHGHALADAAERWKHLYREGIPYFALFNNGYNHPNAFGHALFVEEIMKCIRA